MEEQKPWTSIDLYFKGVHVKKSLPENVKIEDLIKTIDTYLAAGFEASWNVDTNKAHDPIMQATQGQGKKYVCKTCGADADYKEGISKAGKPWKGIFCKETKEHVTWNPQT